MLVRVWVPLGAGSGRCYRMVWDHGWVSDLFGLPWGTVAFLDISLLRRLILYLDVCVVDNRGEAYERLEYYAARDYAAVLPEASDWLAGHAGV
jgi:hypothetical protein